MSTSTPGRTRSTSARTRSARTSTATTRSRRTRPGSGAGSGAGDAWSDAVRAAVVAALVALIGIAIALIATVGTWALSPHTADTGPDTAVRLAVGFWLFAHHVPLEIGGLSLGLVPLGLLLFPGLLAYAGGRQVGRYTQPTTPQDLPRTVIPYALAYGVLAAVIAGVVRSDDVQPMPLTAFVAATVIAGVAGTLGLVRVAGLTPALVGLLPRPVRDVLAAGTVALATVLTVSGVVAALALAVGFPDAVDMFGALDAGWAGGPMLVLVTVAFVPNLVLWVASFTTGVGFTVGVDGGVGPQGVEYGALPVFPPLAAIPPEGEPGFWAYLVLLAPLLGGYAAGSLVARRSAGLPVERLAARAGVGGALGGAALGLLAALSAGSVGNAALARVGPVGWQVGLVAALEMALVAAVVAWEADRRRGELSPRLIDLRDQVRARVTVPAKVKSVLGRR